MLRVVNLSYGLYGDYAVLDMEFMALRDITLIVEGEIETCKREIEAGLMMGYSYRKVRYQHYVPRFLDCGYRDFK